MTQPDFPIHLILAAIILGFDVVMAGIVFLVLKHRGHPLTYVIPPFILAAGILSAVLVYFNLDQPPG